MLLEDFQSTETTELTQWYIGSCLYKIRSKTYISNYLEIITNPQYGSNRQLLILRVSVSKAEITFTARSIRNRNKFFP